jgi:hypothetical protein
MWKAAYVASAIVVGGCLTAVPREAHALGPVEIEGGGLVGGGSNPSHGPNPLSVGIGARAGVELKRVYLGLAVTYYFGDSGNCGGGSPTSGADTSSLPPGFCTLASDGGEVELKQRASLYGVDLGYTLGFPRLSFLKLRPLVQIGDAQITRTGSVTSQDITNGALAGLRSENSFYLQPGLTAFVTAESFFLGVDANLLIMPSVTDIDGVTSNAAGTGNLASSTRPLAAFTSHAQIGFRF